MPDEAPVMSTTLSWKRSVALVPILVPAREMIEAATRAHRCPGMAHGDHLDTMDKNMRSLWARGMGGQFFIYFKYL